MPALLNAMSSPPNVTTVWRSAACTAPLSVTSHTIASPRAPTASTCRTVSRLSLSLSPTTVMSAPSRANRSAVARPIPLPPPVMKATLPVKRLLCVLIS